MLNRNILMMWTEIGSKLYLILRNIHVKTYGASYLSQWAVLLWGIHCCLWCCCCCCCWTGQNIWCERLEQRAGQNRKPNDLWTCHRPCLLARYIDFLFKEHLIETIWFLTFLLPIFWHTWTGFVSKEELLENYTKPW